MKQLVLIGGAAGSGKTTLAQGVAGALNGTRVRPHEIYLSLARQKGIDVSRAFEEGVISSTEASAAFCRELSGSLVACDVHFAIQLLRDSKAAVTGDHASSNPPEPWTRAIDPLLLQEATRLGWHVMLVLLQTTPETIRQRMLERRPDKRRSLVISEIQDEANSELFEFKRLAGYRSLCESVRFDGSWPSETLVAACCDWLGDAQELPRF